MKSLFNIIEIYLENPSDKDMERVLERESTKNNTVKMYEKIKDLERQLDLAKVNERDLNDIITALNEELSEKELQLEEARDMLLQVQDHMHQLSSHTSDGWAGASADNVFNMIEDKLEEIGDERNSY